MSKKPSYTPGPWGLNGYHVGPNPANPMTFRGIASVAGIGAEAAANARLIAAAPELLERLKTTCDCLWDIANAKEGERWGWDWESVIDEAREVIRQVTEPS